MPAVDSKSKVISCLCAYMHSCVRVYVRAPWSEIRDKLDETTEATWQQLHTLPETGRSSTKEHRAS